MATSKNISAQRNTTVKNSRQPAAQQPRPFTWHFGAGGSDVSVGFFELWRRERTREGREALGELRDEVAASTTFNTLLGDLNRLILRDGSPVFTEEHELAFWAQIWIAGYSRFVDVETAFASLSARRQLWGRWIFEVEEQGFALREVAVFNDLDCSFRFAIADSPERRGALLLDFAARVYLAASIAATRPRAATVRWPDAALDELQIASIPSSLIEGDL